MKYEITEEQKNAIINRLGEIPAKFSLELINFFTGLKPIEEINPETKMPIKSE